MFYFPIQLWGNLPSSRIGQNGEAWWIDPLNWTGGWVGGGCVVSPEAGPLRLAHPPGIRSTKCTSLEKLVSEEEGCVCLCVWVIVVGTYGGGERPFFQNLGP